MFRRITLLVAAICTLGLASAQKSARVYGVRVYSDPTAPPALVSFAVDNTNALTEELDLSALVSGSETASVRGAACDGKTYYMLISDDGMLPYRRRP